MNFVLEIEKINNGIKNINDRYVMYFDTITFPRWRKIMQKEGYIIHIEDDILPGKDYELQKLKTKYSFDLCTRSYTD